MPAASSSPAPAHLSLPHVPSVIHIHSFSFLTISEKSWEQNEQTDRCAKTSVKALWSTGSSPQQVCGWTSPHSAGPPACLPGPPPGETPGVLGFICSFALRLTHESFTVSLISASWGRAAVHLSPALRAPSRLNVITGCCDVGANDCPPPTQVTQPAIIFDILLLFKCKFPSS